MYRLIALAQAGVLSLPKNKLPAPASQNSPHWRAAISRLRPAWPSALACAARVGSNGCAAQGKALVGSVSIARGSKAPVGTAPAAETPLPALLLGLRRRRVRAAVRPDAASALGPQAGARFWQRAPTREAALLSSPTPKSRLATAGAKSVNFRFTSFSSASSASQTSSRGPASSRATRPSHRLDWRP